MAFDMSNQIKRSQKIKAGHKVQRRASLILLIAEVITDDWREGVTPTLLNHEGTLIASLRSGLCLTGMGWSDANTAAKEVVAEAFRQVGAKRPAWREAQPEWTEQSVIRVTRTRCAQCEGTLEIGQKTYCSPRCANSHRAKVAYQNDIEGMRAIQRLRRKKRLAAQNG